MGGVEDSKYIAEMAYHCFVQQALGVIQGHDIIKGDGWVGTRRRD